MKEIPSKEMLHLINGDLPGYEWQQLDHEDDEEDDEEDDDDDDNDDDNDETLAY